MHPVQLHHDRIIAPEATPRQWMLLLHGIYGAGRNWGSVGRAFVRERPDWGVMPVDLRQHGQTPRVDGPHTLDAAALDLVRLTDDTSTDARAILGHSFGGKVALVYAALADDPPDHVWVIDSTPDVREPSGSAWEMRRVLSEGPFADRAAVIAAVEALGFANPVAQWMSTNAVAGDDGMLHWRLSRQDMEELLMSFFRTDAWAVLERPPIGTEIHIVKATESSVLSPEAAERVREAGLVNGRVHLHEVEGGHWLNSDNPEALQRLLVDHM